MIRARFSVLLLLATLPLVAACPSSGGGGGDDDDDDGTSPTPTPTPMTVSGTLVNYSGSPLVGESVLVNGTLLTTDAAGAFTLADVTPPYSLAHYNIGSDSATVYIGVTRPDPTIAIVTGPSDRTVTVSGTISPTLGGTPSVDLSAPSPPFYGSSGSVSPNSYTNHDFEWFTTPSITSTMYVTRYDQDANNNVTNIIDHAAQPVTWTDGTTPTQNITMTAAAEGALTGTVTVPGGYALADVSADSQLAGTGVLRLGSTTASTFSFITLDVAGATASVSARAAPTAAGPDDGFGIAFFVGPPTAVATLTVPMASSFTAPAPLATLAAATTISWNTPITASGHSLSISPEDFSGTRMSIYSAAPSITLPDLSSLFATLESEPYSMRVISFSTNFTPDTLLEGGGVSPFPTSGSFSATYSSALHVAGP